MLKHLSNGFFCQNRLYHSRVEFRIISISLAQPFLLYIKASHFQLLLNIRPSLMPQDGGHYYLQFLACSCRRAVIVSGSINTGFCSYVVGQCCSFQLLDHAVAYNFHIYSHPIFAQLHLPQAQDLSPYIKDVFT